MDGEKVTQWQSVPSSRCPRGFAQGLSHHSSPGCSVRRDRAGLPLSLLLAGPGGHSDLPEPVSAGPSQTLRGGFEEKYGRAAGGSQTFQAFQHLGALPRRPCRTPPQEAPWLWLPQQFSRKDRAPVWICYCSDSWSGPPWAFKHVPVSTSLLRQDNCGLLRLNVILATSHTVGHRCA